MPKYSQLMIEEVTFDHVGEQQEALFLFQDKPAPGVVFIHGHKSSAWHSMLYGKLLHRAGFAVCLPSQRGYGFSGGKRDFCGPLTCGGIQEAIRLFTNDERTHGSIALWGVSRGAIVAAQLSTALQDLAGVVLQSGSYDLVRDYAIPKEGELDAIRRNMENEIDVPLDTGLAQRSALYKIDRIKCPILILHGALDKNISIEQAQLLESALSKCAIPHEIHILPEYGHVLPIEIRREYIFPFLQRVLKK